MFFGIHLLVFSLLLSTIRAQNILSCPSDFSPASPFRYYFDKPMSICPLSSSSRDAVVCFRASPTTDGFSIIIPTASEVKVCTIVGSTLCDRENDTNPYIAVAIEISQATQESRLQFSLTSNLTASVDVYFGPALSASSPAIIDSGQVLVISSEGTVIKERVYGQLENFYTVCEVLSNGSIAAIGLTAIPAKNPDCTISADRESDSAARSIMLLTSVVGDIPFMSAERTATLFLSDGACSSGAVVSNNFNMTFENMSVIDPTNATGGPTEENLSAIIGGAVGGVILLLVIVSVAISIGVLVNQRKSRSNYPEHGILARSRTNTGTSYDSEVVPGTTETRMELGMPLNYDSGVDSSPHTPIEKNLITVISQKPDDKWYQDTERDICDIFAASHLPFKLPEGSNDYILQQELPKMLEEIDCLVIIWEKSLPKGPESTLPLYARLAKCVISYPFAPKVRLLTLGSPKTLQIHSSHITHKSLPSSSFTSKDCAQYIHDRFKPSTSSCPVDRRVVGLQNENATNSATSLDATTVMSLFQGMQDLRKDVNAGFNQTDFALTELQTNQNRIADEHTNTVLDGRDDILHEMQLPRIAEKTNGHRPDPKTMDT